MRTQSRRITILLTVVLVVVGVIGLFAPAASAEVCAEVRIWQAGNSTPVGDCVTVFDEWAHIGAGADPTVDGYGAGFSVRVPRPV